MKSTRRLVLVLAALAIAACEAPRTSSFRSFQPGDPAPEYAAANLTGDTVSLASLQGEAVMLNIWATWCVPCRDEMPLLEAVHREYEGDGLRVVGVSVDAAGMRGDIEQFIEDHDLTFTILHDPAERVTRTFRGRAVPETYLFDREGRLVRRWIGKFDPAAPDARRDVERALESD